MNKIDSLHIHNFKFFQDQEVIKIGGNHMLLYGENGSGKSSIYWSLYTLFEASLKVNDTQIKKYFSKTIYNGEDCLVNIHAQETVLGSDNYNSFIEVLTDDDQPLSYKISSSDVEIRGDENATRINYASDYINYRLLLGFSSFAHSEPINLYNLFTWNIFYYIRFNAVEVTRDGNKTEMTSAADIWKAVQKGPDEFDLENDYSENEFSEYIVSTPYKDYEKTLNDFHERFQSLIDYINLHGPIYLEKLGYNNFKYRLHLESASFVLASRKFELNPFKVEIIITEYDGIPNSVKKPHSFLNEARFSAMAISIRLAILKQKLQENCLKFIVLDDLLISLDMSNREKTLEVFLSDEFSTNYQLFVLTHDFSFFQLCKRKISDAEKTNWIYYELYVDEDKKKPEILKSDTSYAKACSHLKSFDYPAAGNYFRKATEELFENYFPREVTISENGEKKTTLRGYLDAALKLYGRLGQDKQNLKQLDSYLFLLLNPLSHRAVDTNVYKIELNRVKTLLPILTKEIKDLEVVEIVAAENLLIIYYPTGKVKEYEYYVKTNEPIYYFKKGKYCFLSDSNCKSYKSSTIFNKTVGFRVRNEHFHENNIVEIHKKVFIRWKKKYDNSYLENVFVFDKLTGKRACLKEIING